MTPLHGIACFYDVGFGARAVSRKTPIYFIFIYFLERYGLALHHHHQYFSRIRDLINLFEPTHTRPIIARCVALSIIQPHFGMSAEKYGIFWEFFPKWGGGGHPNSQNFCKITKSFLACQIHPKMLKHVLQRWGGDI